LTTGPSTASLNSALSSSNAFTRCGNGILAQSGVGWNRFGCGGFNLFMALSSGGDQLPGGRSHESVHERTQFNEAIHGQPRKGYDPNRSSLWGRHPRWKKKSRSIKFTDDQVVRTSMLDATDNHNDLAGKWMERIDDHRLKRQMSGIMNSP